MGKTDAVSISEQLPDAIDLFFCSASFESRCLTIPLMIEGERIKHVAIGENLNHKSLHGINPATLLAHFGKRAEIISLSTADPFVTADSWFGSIATRAESAKSIVVDITAFTHEALLILFRMLVEHAQCDELVLAYNVAEEYSVGDDPKKKWLSRGIGDVRSVLGYAGELRPSRPLHLIVMTGFEHERVVELIRAYEPAAISLGYGIGSGSSNHEEVNQLGLNLVRAVYGSAEVFRFPVHDPLGSCESVLSQSHKRPGFNTVLSAMNTKLSTIGAAMAAIRDPSLQLSYAQALVYNTAGYSTPSDEVVCVSVSLADLREQLAQELELA